MITLLIILIIISIIIAVAVSLGSIFLYAILAIAIIWIVLKIIEWIIKLIFGG